MTYHVRSSSRRATIPTYLRFARRAVGSRAGTPALPKLAVPFSLAVVLALAAMAAVCQSSTHPGSAVPTGSLALTSAAFADQQPIPPKYTCEGGDVSPPLAWSGVPAGTKGFVLTCFDPDAPRGGWVHWAVHGIPAGAVAFDEGAMPAGATGVKNDFGKAAWGGPCPPKGHGAHHYVFTLYALSVNRLEPAPTTYRALEEAAQARALMKAVLTGTYERK